jgi:hypothetical protein
MAIKIEVYKLKPLRKLFRPYYSPNFNSYEMGYALSNLSINSTKIYNYYLVLININTKFLFMAPIKNDIIPNVEITRIIIKDINDHLTSLNPNLKINNICSDDDSKFGKMIEDNDRPETVKLGKIIYKRNVSLDYLEFENITLHLNPSPFLNNNRVVDRVIRTIRDKIGVRSNLWLL